MVANELADVFGDVLVLIAGESVTSHVALRPRDVILGKIHRGCAFGSAVGRIDGK